MLTDDQKVRVRLHAGYPMFGNQAELASLQWGQNAWRIQVQNQQLEFAMNSFAPAEESVLLNDMLPSLEQLRADIYGVRDNADTSAAAVWTRNKDELSERQQLYRLRRIELCNFLNISTGPNITGSQTRIRS